MHLLVGKCAIVLSILLCHIVLPVLCFVLFCDSVVEMESVTTFFQAQIGECNVKKPAFTQGQRPLSVFTA